ncbi:MAG TPA: DUF3592 domain-containing protein [Xanthobacteraceae bacterium]|nr:DUF3592 domain-containing protein [Xanthobacteraceae bacterium]
MGGDRSFWLLFGGIFLAVGLAFLFGAAGVNLFADPQQLEGAPTWVFALAGLLASGFGGFILRRTFLDRAREKRLMDKGTPVPATVTDVRRSRIEINRQSRWYVCYRYEFGGRKLTGESHSLPGEWVAGFKPGDAVRIKVDPQKPEDSLFMGPA